MSSLAEKLTSEAFREIYAERKPYFELLDGEATQKSLPTKLHSALQLVLLILLKELGFKARPELSLAISEQWQPTPDVCGIMGPEPEEFYPTHPIAVAIEILSPDDRFTRVIQKCRKYCEWGVMDILVFDPVAREAWFWDETGNLTRVQERYEFRSRRVELNRAEVFRRMDDELR